jgi:hypothetical protein
MLSGCGGVEFDEKIDVALSGVVTSCNGTEKAKSFDAKAFAKVV